MSLVLDIQGLSVAYNRKGLALEELHLIGEVLVL